MPDTAPSNLTAGSAVDGTEIVHAVQGGNSRRFTFANVRTWLDTFYQPISAALTTLAAAGNSAVLAATTASFLTADETKLDGIEALADVTDAANVAAAGAAMLATADQTITGGARVTTLDDGTKSSGTYTPDPGDRPMIKIVNGGAFTLAPGTNVGAYLLDVTNNGSAGAITTSGWTKVVGSFGTTNGHKYRCHCSIGDAGSLLTIQAMQ